MKNTHLLWVDYMRVIACFLVVLAHCCDPFVAKFYGDMPEYLSGAAFGSAMRISVPIFAMISGVLLMPVQMTMEQFYRKRLTRILIPLIVWSVVTPIFYTLYVNNVDSALSPSDYTIESTINKIIFFPINFNYDTTPLWYLYMLVGLYLIMPIISPWAQNASKKTLQLFLKIWGFSLLIPYIKILAPAIGYQGIWGSYDILGGCLWNSFGTFYYFSGFIGYIVLAFYLVKFPLNWSRTRAWATLLPMWIAGYAITFGGFLVAQEFFPGDPAVPESYQTIEIMWYFSGIGTFLMTFAVFVGLMRVSWKPSKCITYLASLTFGIYLSHFLIVQMSYDFLYALPIPPFVKIPILALAAFSVTALIVAAIKKLKFSKYIIG